ncbi:hypothetical protein M9H77_03032 [Catharanthus roseus]|uniref:Uncharacterized protein n=1 Tax=Catharanthus roseus TaxID=4058 RepID=A0ACC0CA90_CATRO|nr:hypothetical protein M9H77_03032 [Catharanthus roseus]
MDLKTVLRCPCSKCKNKKIIHSKIVKEHLLRKYELELQNINLNITGNEIQEKITKGIAKWFRNEEKFHEVRRKVEEDAEALAGSEAAHFIAESSRAAVGLAPLSASFDKPMRWLFKYNHLAYIPFPPMMPLFRFAMTANISISTSTVLAVTTSELPSQDSSTPPSIHAFGATSSLPDPKDGAPPSSTDAT